jgi:hypothetical protein
MSENPVITSVTQERRDNNRSGLNSLLGLHCFAAFAAVACGSPK